MTIGRHDSHPPEVICRPAGNGLCEPRIPTKVPDLSGVPLAFIPLADHVGRVLPDPDSAGDPDFASAI